MYFAISSFLHLKKGIANKHFDSSSVLPDAVPCILNRKGALFGTVSVMEQLIGSLSVTVRLYTSVSIAASSTTCAMPGMFSSVGA